MSLEQVSNRHKKNSERKKVNRHTGDLVGWHDLVSQSAFGVTFWNAVNLAKLVRFHCFPLYPAHYSPEATPWLA